MIDPEFVRLFREGWTSTLMSAIDDSDFFDDEEPTEPGVGPSCPAGPPGPIGLPGVVDFTLVLYPRFIVSNGPPGRCYFCWNAKTNLMYQTSENDQVYCCPPCARSHLDLNDETREQLRLILA